MRTHLARIFQLALIAALILVAWVMLRRPSSGCIAEKDARLVAGDRFKEYSARENVASKVFGPPEANRSESGWAFHFSSDSSPRHLVTVVVHCGGGSEV